MGNEVTQRRKVLIRDKGPLSSLGHGVTSRDIPLDEGETEGPSANSGAIAKRLNGHPFAKFIATNVTTVVATGVSAMLVKKGGLKLAKTIDDAARITRATGGTSHATRLVESVGELRKVMDTLQGVSRSIGEGVDPDYFYKNLVLETAEGGLTTGYSDALKNTRFGMHFSQQEIRDAARGLTSEPAAIWAHRDEVQQRLVGLGRRLPYTLPAMYVTQRGFVDPLFGDNEQKSKVNWYNPVDVVADFAKQSVLNTLSILGPQELAGAATSTAKRALSTKLYSSATTPFQEKLQRRFVDLNTILGEVGNDLVGITDKVIRSSTQFSGAFNRASIAARQDQPEQLQVFKSVRAGVREARERNAPFAQIAKEAFIGRNAEGPGQYGLIDAMPAMRGFRSGFSEFNSRFKIMGQGYDVVTKAITYDKAIAKTKGIQKIGDPETAEKVARSALGTAIEEIQNQHSSRLSNFASTVEGWMGGKNVYGSRFRKSGSEFYNKLVEKEFRSQVEKHLVNEGASEKGAKLFSTQVQVKNIPLPGKGKDISQIFSIGKDPILKEGPDFFQELATRAATIKGLQPDSGLSGDVLERALKNANSQFANKEFQKNLTAKINSQWNTLYNENLIGHTQGLFKPQKQAYEAFAGKLSVDQKEYLQRQSADILGIKLLDTNGKRISNDIVKTQLARNGIDANNFSSLKAFLIQNKKMSGPSLSGGFNIFGLKQVGFDEARQKGFFDYLSDRQKTILNDLNRQSAINDPISNSIGHSSIEGLYSSRSGKILDTTKLTGTIRSLGNFFASEFEIPIVHISPKSIFGVQQMQEMGKKSPLHFVPGGGVQPFGDVAKQTDADFFIYQTKRSFFRKTKGEVTAYSTDSEGITTANKLQGFYRPINNLSEGLMARQARYASGLMNPEGEKNPIKSLISDFKEGRPLSLSKRIKSALDIAEDQPSSIPGLLSRFARRKTDIENPTVLASLLGSKTGKATIGKNELTLNTNRVFDAAGKAIEAETTFSVTDQAGKVIADHEQFVGAATRFFGQTNDFGFSQKVMKAVERANADLFKFGERQGAGTAGVKGLSDLYTAEQVVRFAQDLKRYDAGLKALPSNVRSSFSRIDQILQQGELLSSSMTGSRSPSITTRLDELKSELFKYLGQRNAALKGGSGTEPINAINDALLSLRRSGQIGKSEFLEAQGAALSSLYNASSFAGYAAKNSTAKNAAAAITHTLDEVASSDSIAGLFRPFSTSDISLTTSTLRKPIANIVPFLRRSFGTADFNPSDKANVLGGNSSTVFVPTFGTVFNKNPFGAIASALGITTYNDPENFSNLSMFSGHMIERLNKNFGTLGIGLDVSKYKSPLDLFARGYVAKRVLPIVAGGSTLMAVDRTIGAYNQPKDANGERVYSPFFTGIAATGLMETQAAVSGVMPGGKSYQEKREELTTGDVPIRQGRYWPLGNTPFKGGKIQYYRPSWYQKFQAGAMFTSDTYGSPAEKALFYNDYSPLRPLDPYRFERKHYEDRPYPLTGEYFSGPFGPATSALNATIGKILKPQVRMHKEEVDAGLANYVRVGQSGAFDASGYVSNPNGAGQLFKDYGYTTSMGGVGYSGGSLGTGSSSVAATAYPEIIASNQSNAVAGSMLYQQNASYGAMAGSPLGTANKDITTRISNQNRMLTNASYGPPRQAGIVPPKIIPTGKPINYGSTGFQLSETGYRTQELAGIYGFMQSSIREGFGFGKADLQPQRSVLQSASRAYGTSRSFYDQNFGGMGDVPLPGQGPLGNIELSEITRRFIPKERNDIDYLNPIRNSMAEKYPFLPGPNYFTNFKTGDPYTKVPEGELRLPGVAYERFNTPISDDTGKYGRATQLSILGDVAPYSPEYRSLNRSINSQINSPEERASIIETRKKVESITKREEFSPYKYKYSSAEEMGMGGTQHTLLRAGEYLSHRDTIFNTKFMPNKTAAEDYERTNVYGASFPQWQDPIKSFISPMVYKATQRGPLAGATVLGALGSTFGVTPRAKIFASAVGTLTGGAAGAYGSISERITGDRFIPKDRKKQMALEEYTDILTYTKNMSLYSQAQKAGDTEAANRFKQSASRTMYGADIYGDSIENLSLSVPKRKREHFKAMIGAPEEERERILSTAPRLERRIFQAAWGMDVEKKPDLVDYFSKHELPDAGSEVWHPNTNMEHVKIKIGQNMGVDLSQMGYYPQQLKEANLVNPSYPSFNQSSSQDSVLEKLKRMMLDNGLTGSVSPVYTPYASNSIDMSVGVR